VAILLLPPRRRLQELRDAAAADDAAGALSPALDAGGPGDRVAQIPA
jgi:hypothetical protein